MIHDKSHTFNVVGAYLYLVKLPNLLDNIGIIKLNSFLHCEINE